MLWKSSLVLVVFIALAGCTRRGELPAAELTANAPGDSATATSDPSELVVQLLDVGQGDATLITNGGSTVLIDGGPEMADLGRHLDQLGLNGDTIDVVVISHPHADHYNGLRELFRDSRRITVRFFFDSKDVSPNVTLASLRDSVLARESRGELVYRDSDDPCGNDAKLCTITLRGGALLHIIRPPPLGDSPNNRSTPVKLVGPDSASFTMWFAGDAEARAVAAFDSLEYDWSPGMAVHVLKANHHGSCNGTTERYLDMVRPSWIVASLGASNDFGHMHTQTVALLQRRAVPWYRTDQNGTITIRSPGTANGVLTIVPERGKMNMTGASDRAAATGTCSGW